MPSNKVPFGVPSLGIVKSLAGLLGVESQEELGEKREMWL